MVNLNGQDLDAFYEHAQKITGMQSALRVHCLSICAGDTAEASELYAHLTGNYDHSQSTPITSADIRMQCLSIAKGDIDHAAAMVTFVTGGDK